MFKLPGIVKLQLSPRQSRRHSGGTLTGLAESPDMLPMEVIDARACLRHGRPCSAWCSSRLPGKRGNRPPREWTHCARGGEATDGHPTTQPRHTAISANTTDWCQVTRSR